MKMTRIALILNKLMADKNIRVAELARQIGLPQPTVHRIATGACEHPHLSSLQPIANFFSINIDQLKGHQPISWLDHATRVPLLDWEQVENWLLETNKPQQNEYILTDASVGNRAFALKIRDASMEPLFPRNTILITDPDKIPKDRSYVIAKLRHYNESIFRQLLIDAEKKYLKPLSPDLERYKMTIVENGDKILSTVVQAKHNYEE